MNDNNTTSLNSTALNSGDDTGYDIFYEILTYVSLVIIFVGLVSNTTSFVIFRFHSQFKTMPSMVYLSFVAVTDSMSLWVWNLDHYLTPNYGFLLEELNEPICRISLFDQFLGLESSALLLSMVTVDRYFTVVAIPGSFVSKLPFGTMKSALIWSTVIVACVATMNIHILVLRRSYETDVTTNLVFTNATFNLTTYTYTTSMECYKYSNGFEISPSWEDFHMIIYILIPFCIMTFFNGLLIKNVLMTSNIHSKHQTQSNEGGGNKPNAAQLQAKKAQRKKQSLTISLVLVTCLFLVMTLPSSIMFGFFYAFFSQNFGQTFLLIVDYLLFANNSSLFFVSLLTNAKFRGVVFAKVREVFGCNKSSPNAASKKYLQTQTKTQIKQK